jgi:hypothetical protein
LISDVSFEQEDEKSISGRPSSRPTTNEHHLEWVQLLGTTSLPPMRFRGLVLVDAIVRVDEAPWAAINKRAKGVG